MDGYRMQCSAGKRCCLLQLACVGCELTSKFGCAVIRGAPLGCFFCNQRDFGKRDRVGRAGKAKRGGKFANAVFRDISICEFASVNLP